MNSTIPATPPREIDTFRRNSLYSFARSGVHICYWLGVIVLLLEPLISLVNFALLYFSLNSAGTTLTSSMAHVESRSNSMALISAFETFCRASYDWVILTILYWMAGVLFDIADALIQRK